MSVLLANNATGRLAGSITTSQTSVSLRAGEGSLFPTPSNSNEWFPITFLKSTGEMEIMHCTSRTNDLLTVLRGMEGTAARSWDTGDRAGLRFTEAAFDTLVRDSAVTEAQLAGDPANGLGVAMVNGAVSLEQLAGDPANGLGVALVNGALTQEDLPATSGGGVTETQLAGDPANGLGAALVNGTIITAQSIAEIESYSVPIGSVLSLNAGNRSGTFDIISGNYSSNLSGDTFNGIYIGTADDPTGLYKVAKRRHNGSVDAKWFGATGNGSTNDSPYFQAALDSLGDGDSLHVSAPNVSYKLSAALNINKRVGIVGYGSLFTVSTSIPCFNMDAIGSSISGIHITGNRTPNQIGIRISRDYVKVRDVDINLVDVGIEVWGGVWHRIEHIRMANIRSKVIIIGNVVGTVVEDLRYNTNVASYAEPAVGVALFGEGCNFSDLDLIHAGTGVDISTEFGTRSSTWNFFNSCSFDTSMYGLRVRNTDSTGDSVRGAMFDHCWFSSHREVGARLDGNYDTDGITFNGCTFINNKKGGLSVEEATTNVQVVGCTFGSNSMVSYGVYPHIVFSSVGRMRVTGTNFTSWGGQNAASAAAIERTVSGGEIIIDGCYSFAEVTSEGFADFSTNGKSLGINFGNLPSYDPGP